MGAPGEDAITNYLRARAATDAPPIQMPQQPTPEGISPSARRVLDDLIEEDRDAYLRQAAQRINLRLDNTRARLMGRATELARMAGRTRVHREDVIEAHRYLRPL